MYLELFELKADLAALAGEQTKPQTVQEETVRDLLLQLDCYKSMGPDEIHPRVLRKLVEVIAETLSIIYQRSLGRVRSQKTGGLPM